MVYTTEATAPFCVCMRSCHGILEKQWTQHPDHCKDIPPGGLTALHYMPLSTLHVAPISASRDPLVSGQRHIVYVFKWVQKGPYRRGVCTPPIWAVPVHQTG